MSLKTNDDSSTDLSSSDYEDVEDMTKDRKQVYQIQFVKDDYYKFVCVGFFKKEQNILVELTKFEHEDYYCVINSNFIDQDSSNGLCLFDLITMDVLKKDGKQFKIILSVEVENPNFNSINKGNLMIWLEFLNKRIPLKTGLSHPGVERLPYYIIAELKSPKIEEIINKNLNE
jgi:hypothetical protein